MSSRFADGESFAFTTGVYGDRPTFLLSRGRASDRAEITLYELAPEAVAEARRERFERAGQTGVGPIRALSTAVVDGETPAEVHGGGDPPHDWEEWCAVKVATLRGTRFSEVTYLLQQALSEAGRDPEVVCTGRQASVALPEAAGVRLSIAFRALKPVQRRDRLRAITDGVAEMSLGECYFWHSKARSPNAPSGVKALRVLLADHVD